MADPSPQADSATMSLLAPSGSGQVPGTAGNVYPYNTLGLHADEMNMPLFVRDPNMDLGASESESPSRARPALKFQLGQEATTIGAAASQWSTMDSGQLEELQHALYDNGFYPSSYYTGKAEPVFGSPDDQAGFSAYRSVLRAAAKSKLSVDHILSLGGPKADLVGQGKALGARSGMAETTHITPLTAPADINLLTDHVARTLLGRAATDEEKQRIVGTVQGSEQAQGAAMFGAAKGANTQVTGPVNAQSAAEQQFKTGATQQEYQADQSSQIYGAMLNIVKGNQAP